MMKNIATTACSYALTDSLLTAAIVPIFSTGSAKADNNAVILEGTKFTLTALAKGAFVNPGPITLTIEASSTKDKVSTKKIVLGNDKTDSQTITLTNPSGGATTTASFQIEITSAGQSKAKGE